MDQESLAEAFGRLGVAPLPPVDELQRMSEDERRAAVRASGLTAEQYEQLPASYRDSLRRRAEQTLARRASRNAEQAAARRVS